MEPVQEVSQSQEVSSQQQTTQPPKASRLLHKKDEITPKIGQRESYKSYDTTILLLILMKNQNYIKKIISIIELKKE